MSLLTVFNLEEIWLSENQLLNGKGMLYKLYIQTPDCCVIR